MQPNEVLPQEQLDRVLECLRWIAPGWLCQWRPFVAMTGLEASIVALALGYLAGTNQIRLERPTGDIEDGFRVWLIEQNHAEN